MRIFLFAALCFAILSGSEAAADGCDVLKACQDMAWCKYTYRGGEWKDDPQVSEFEKAMQRDDPAAEKDMAERCHHLAGKDEDWTNNGKGCPLETINQVGRKARINACVGLAQPPVPPNTRVCANCRTNDVPQIVCGKPTSLNLHKGDRCDCNGHSGKAITMPEAPCD
ncbi:hypothetical protein LQG66_02745 [Bradyrhizobium ontarionense]|uniref:Uncharacterized protein n=1 Tax=Bradyrhizobium ontarionense TaxID=2898149 RepID=A0ABY3RCX3_9BRAD|nr:hypothetical protein [Bradyrhizobium sp. A19]UFZ05259.1 hypothetical protein LQG66_02745 [Bradyrhizobium sp. A19]